MIMLCMAILMCGCGKRDVALDNYKANMDTYFSSVKTLDERMNAIDVSNSQTEVELEASYTKILGYLDQLNTITAQMAQLEVPEQFSLAENLADETSENMNSAVELYHQLYEADEYNEGVAEAAYEYYERANKRIRYIRSILQGVIPDELEVEYDDEYTENN